MISEVRVSVCQNEDTKECAVKVNIEPLEIETARLLAEWLQRKLKELGE